MLSGHIDEGVIFFTWNNCPALLFLFYFYGRKYCQERQEILLKHKKNTFTWSNRVVTQAGCAVFLLRAIQNLEQCPPADPALSSKVGLENTPKISSSLSYSMVL